MAGPKDWGSTMRSSILRPALLLGALTAATGAEARGFTISDFGSVPSDAVCVERGRQLFETFGTGEIKATDWTVNAYGVGYQNVDAAVVCSYGPDGKVRVSIVLHNWGDDAEDRKREAIPEQLRLIWDRF